MCIVCVCVGEGSKVKESIIIFATTLSACLYTMVFQCNWNNNYNYKKKIKKNKKKERKEIKIFFAGAAPAPAPAPVFLVGFCYT